MEETASHSTSPAQPGLRSQRITLILFLGVFLLPMGIAYLLLTTGWWHNAGSVNHGELVNPAFPLSTTLHEELAGTSPQKPWVLLMLTNSHCDASCQNALMLARQTRTLMGPDQHRVKIAVIHTAPLDADTQTFFTSNAFSHITQIKENFDHTGVDTLLERLPQLFPSTATTQLLIVDPLGNGVIVHSVSSDEKEAILTGRDFVKDLKRLLKLSRIG